MKLGSARWRLTSDAEGACELCIERHAVLIVEKDNLVD